MAGTFSLSEPTIEPPPSFTPGLTMWAAVWAVMFSGKLCLCSENNFLLRTSDKKCKKQWVLESN